MKKETPFGVINVDANGVAIDDAALRAAMAASNAANPQRSTGGYLGPQMPTTDQIVNAAQNAGATSYTPGYTPDYGALIQGDPIYRQQQGDLSAQGIASAQDLKGGTARALINFGEVPDLMASIKGLGLDPNSPMFKMLFANVDEATRQGARDMTSAGLSTTARLDREHQTSLGTLMDQLAARGVVRSGATTSGSNLEGQRYGAAQFDARKNLLDYLSGLQTAYTQSENARQASLTQGLTDATGRQIAQHPATGPTGTAPTGTSTGAPPGSFAPLPPVPTAPSGDPAPSNVPAFYPAIANAGYPTAPKPPASTTGASAQAVQNSLVKRLNLPQ